MYKVRFNLGRGPRYMTWKIENPDGTVEYLEPNDISLSMYGCELKNNPKAAKRIFDGANKYVCAFIKCKTLIISEPLTEDKDISMSLMYNPRVKPYWVNNDGDNLDGKKIDWVITNGRKLWFKNLDYFK